MSDKPTLYLFVGYPGAGKTTVARWIADRTGAVHLWADQERLEMFGQPKHDQAESAQLYGYLNQKAADILADGRSVIFDTNFNFARDRQHLANIAAEHGADHLIIWMTTPKDLAKQRATGETLDGNTRLLGRMSDEDFDRIAGHLEPPTDNEKIIKIDGTKLDPEDALRLLGIDGKN